MNDNNQNSESTETVQPNQTETEIKNHEDMLRAKRRNKWILAAVLVSYIVNMSIGAYYIFTKNHQNAITHVMLANVSCLFIIDQAVSNN